MDAKRLSRLHDLGITPWVQRHAAQAQSVRPRPLGESRSTPPAAALTVQPTLAADARASAIAAMDWAKLKAAVRDCTVCGLRGGCTQTVFGVGDEQAR